jgi:hypothetical protein
MRNKKKVKMMDKKFINKTLKDERKIFHENLDLLLSLIELTSQERPSEALESIEVYAYLLKTYCKNFISWEERKKVNEKENESEGERCGKCGCGKCKKWG